MQERPYEPSDLPNVMEIYTLSIHSLATPYYSGDQLAAWAPIPPDAARWQERLAGLHTFVAEVDGTLAGFASYTDEGYLDFLFTHPNFARCGIATRLYRDVESALCAAGVAQVTTLASLAGRPFFDRQGFLVEREENADCRGVYLRRFAMYKPLSKA